MSNRVYADSSRPAIRSVPQVVDPDRTYVLIHFSATAGGLRKRMEMLVRLLSTKYHVQRVQTLRSFLRFLCGNRVAPQKTRILVYASLMAPFLILVRLRWGRVPVYYMVRGDEVSYAEYANRRVRAYAAAALQKAMSALGCYFVFVCEDLRVLFEKRLGAIRRSLVLPNTIGSPLPKTRRFEHRVALVGDFGTVKNTEWAISRLTRGDYEVHLYGVRAVPATWRRPWLINHGIVDDLKDALAQRPALLLLPYVDAGFPNVLIEALLAGCPVAVHDAFPFRYLPVHEAWRFRLSDGLPCATGVGRSELECFLDRLRTQNRDFVKDNPRLLDMIESSWENRVWDILR